MLTIIQVGDPHIAHLSCRNRLLHEDKKQKSFHFMNDSSLHHFSLSICFRSPHHLGLPKSISWGSHRNDKDRFFVDLRDIVADQFVGQEPLCVCAARPARHAYIRSRARPSGITSLARPNHWPFRSEPASWWWWCATTHTHTFLFLLHRHRSTQRAQSTNKKARL